MNTFASLNLGLFPSPQNKPKHLEILWGLFQEDCTFFSALTFLGDESWQLKIRSWCYGHMWDQSNCPKGSSVLLSPCFSPSPFVPVFYVFPCDVLLNLEHVRHREASLSSSPISGQREATWNENAALPTPATFPVALASGQGCWFTRQHWPHY